MYYAFTTGGVFGHIQEFQSTDLATWTPVLSPGPLTPEPSWVNPGLEWAPSVAQFAGTWVMFYATFDESLDAECVTEATSASVTGPYINDSAGPFICTPLPGPSGTRYGGDIDPDVFVDANGTPYLLWKANPGGSENQAVIWSRQLSSDGLSFAAGQPARPAHPAGPGLGVHRREPRHGRDRRGLLPLLLGGHIRERLLLRRVRGVRRPQRAVWQARRPPDPDLDRHSGGPGG